MYKNFNFLVDFQVYYLYFKKIHRINPKQIQITETQSLINKNYAIST
ncbi:Uncharacterized protein dnm_054330 [Desulfonema magnum]|uniref:Uncharacterized protein n=1 Tax=Desulfonema magnum TaxID=45655 RepID=A0A975GQ07_9BACT|nr:Uncharacterized protein dnm_054330 [Desulfonema magnum]